MADWQADVELARRGDAAAFDRVVRRFQGMGVAYAYSILGNFQSAEDAAQEAFIQAYSDLPSLREPRAFPAWLRRLVFKHCDRLSRGKRLPMVPLEQTLDVPAPTLPPAEAAEQAVTRGLMQQSILALPESERTPVALFYINGYSIAEVGQFLDLPVTTVKNRLHSARQHLRGRMIGMVEDTLKQHAPGDDFSERVRRVIEGIRQVEWQSIWLTFEGTAYACLRHMDPDLTLDYLMGVCGGAFKFIWHPDNGPGMCNLLFLGEDPVRRLAAALGHPYTYVADYGQPDAARSRERLAPLFVESLDAGRPLLGMGVDCSSDPCLVTGYDRGGEVLYGRSYFQAFPEWLNLYIEPDTGYFRNEAWYDTCVGLVAFGPPDAVPDRRQVLRQSLAHALDLARTPTRDTVTSVRPDGGLWSHSGLVAYDHLADGFLHDPWFVSDPEVLSPTVERLMYDGIWFLLETRENAERFVRRFTDLGGATAAELAALADVYVAEAATLRRATEYVPMNASEKCFDIALPEARRELRRIVLKAKAIEEQAVAAIEAVLPIL
ncbi:MAG: RNA polymerase sigma factor [Anaerolineae bacterium]